jgi:pyrimidine operon attenuation protein/uracil phosphoribosyltransferase
MAKGATRLLSSQKVASAMDRLYHAVAAQLPQDMPVAIVGIRTRGQVIATRLVQRLRAEHPDRSINHGVLDITFYRDDLSRRRGVPLVRATEIDFEIDDAFVVLVDDVLQTGRSIRAALDALSDFGRPRIIRLAVLIDRGGREVPISADFVGHRLLTESDQRVQVLLQETDGEEGVYITKSAH